MFGAVCMNFEEAWKMAEKVVGKIPRLLLAHNSGRPFDPLFVR